MSGDPTDKTRLYELFAEVGKALGSVGRLELLDLLAQAPHTVEDLARVVEHDEIEIDAGWLDVAGIKTVHAIVEAARQRDR